MVLATSIGKIRAEFKKMRIKHPRLEKVHSVCENLMITKREVPYCPQNYSIMFADTQSGKSTAVESYIETKVVDYVIAQGLFPASMDRREIARQQRVFLHITLSSAATLKSLSTDIRRKFGDPRAESGSAETGLRMSYDLLRAHGTQLLCIDEFQHLSAQMSRGTDGKFKRSCVLEDSQLTDELKNMLNNGLVPILFVGLPEARHIIVNAEQMGGRSCDEIDFGRLRRTVKEEWTIFKEYIGRLCLKLQQHNLFEDKSDLVCGDIPICIHAVAGGRLGMASNLVRAACEVAFESKATRVTREHLEKATDIWAIPFEIIDYNPFTEGRVRDAVLKAA